MHELQLCHMKPSLICHGILFFILIPIAGGLEQQIIIDYADEKVAVKCDLCADRWLFIISTGRSGSTSIFTMLNLVPGELN